ncbi:MAG: heavy metal-associated domain-containing protein [Halodesulfurarchaeum sp.]|nr:heavy metal-associated domain-containing protein [Halodesulfurarchaeum sp.]
MTRTISVSGMTCEHCEQTVEDALEALEGITSATADESADSVAIEGNAEREALREAVEGAGYEFAA